MTGLVGGGGGGRAVVGGGEGNFKALELEAATLLAPLFAPEAATLLTRSKRISLHFIFHVPNKK
jgi:hypothetical protein